MNGMAEVIAAHHGYRFEFEVKDVEDAVSCDCGQPMVLSDHSAHVAEELTKAGYGKLPQSCVCGDMQAGTADFCELHTDVRLRTFNERMDFEQAFDARVEASKSKS